MNINIITKILDKRLPEDIIREISKYFIKKIRKDDIRFEVINSYIIYKKLYTTQQIYYNGKFHYNLLHFGGSRKSYFLLYNFPDLFLEYTFCIDDRISAIRFWMEDNKCEVPIDGYWIEKTKFN